MRGILSVMQLYGDVCSSQNTRSLNHILLSDELLVWYNSSPAISRHGSSNMQA